MVGEHYKHILMAYDGSENADNALIKGITIAQINQADLTVVYVVDLRSTQLIAPKQAKAADLVKEHGAEMKKKIRDMIDLKGLANYNIRIEEGNPKTVITYDLIEQIGADMVVCGSSGLDSYDQLMIGSTSENIVRYSPIDVLVVK